MAFAFSIALGGSATAQESADPTTQAEEGAPTVNPRQDLYTSYWKRIRRLVDFYWQQHVDDLPASVRLPQSAYTTSIRYVLDDEGALESIEVVAESGSDELDEAVVRAFQIAGPFPTPPQGLIQKDGRVYSPDVDFELRKQRGPGPGDRLRAEPPDSSRTGKEEHSQPPRSAHKTAV